MNVTEKYQQFFKCTFGNKSLLKIDWSIVDFKCVSFRCSFRLVLGVVLGVDFKCVVLGVGVSF